MTDAPPPTAAYKPPGAGVPKKSRAGAAAEPAAWPDPDDGGAVDRFCADLAQTDIGNGERLRARFGRDLRFVPGIGWQGWDGARWSRDRGEDLAHLSAQRTVKAILGEAATAKGARAAGLGSHAFDSGSSSRVAAMQREAKPHLTAMLADFDARPNLFACANGTLELGADARLREHRRGDLLTRVSPVVYDPAADCPCWKEFLHDLFADEPVLIEFLARWFGYCLTGSIVEQVFCIFHGEGSNGKSTLLDALRWVFGDYAAVLPFASLLEDQRRRGGEPSPDIARLPGTRLVTASEPELGRSFSDAQVKTLTGEGVITARKLREEFFEFAPTFKLTLSCNNRPNVRGQDHGIWRRILLVPFERTFAPEEIDKTLPERLRGEASGILNWVVEGCRAWCRGGLDVPDLVRSATVDYRRGTDPIGRFLDEWTVRGTDESGMSVGHVGATLLFSAYRDWCVDAAEQAVSQTLFGKRLADRGLRKEKIGTYVYVDVVLTQEARDIVAERAAARGGREGEAT